MAKKAEEARLMALDFEVHVASEVNASMAAMKREFPQETNLVWVLMQVLSSSPQTAS